jgi:hypothetical protein
MITEEIRYIYTHIYAYIYIYIYIYLKYMYQYICIFLNTHIFFKLRASHLLGRCSTT